ncbi:MAG: adenylate/guanylate cyclase domain-containing protein, partial [Myxococcota bacterium]|nr:adenylate/guanylate cyclase domain-containing protein [Myxococcota bacterium]
DVVATATYLESPLRPVKERMVGEVRIHPLADETFPRFNMVSELRTGGFTDYVVLPLRTSKQRDDVVTFATRAEGGFSVHEIELLRQVVVLTAPYAALQAERLLTRTISQAYLGSRTGRLVADGQLHRGAVRFLDAALWISDLRDFTAVSEAHPPKDIIALLNGFFEAVDEAVSPHGGEILKLMGDAALVVFPDDDGVDPCKRALDSAMTLLDTWPGPKAATSELVASTRFGIGLHYGRVAYGNIGAEERLDFTVIGHDVNVTSRLASMCSGLNAAILCSDLFAARSGGDLDAFGDHPLRGLPGRLLLHGVRHDALADHAEPTVAASTAVNAIG